MITSSAPDITAILNISKEGLLAHNSMQSIVNARTAAKNMGITVEIIVVADRPNAETSEYLETATVLGASVVIVGVGDLGLARNAGVAHGVGRYVAFLDGDDLWGRHWLVRAFRAAEESNRATVWHPEASLFFGDSMPTYWLPHYDMDTTRGDWIALGLRNHWTSLSFAARDIYRQVPYRATTLDRGFGYEDWCWNAETIGNGIMHRHVPGTVHLVRQRAQSLVRQSAARAALVTPHDLFRDKVGLFPGG